MLQHEELKNKLSGRAAKSVASLGTLLEAFQLKNVVDEDMVQELLQIRAKFKLITATTGVRGTIGPTATRTSKRIRICHF
ncbi:unnamed protein product [Peronospora destructor]|uniref:Uncharacterized protein n=1 Tax=Peronospora destructor TaxID=86335 RepID=A0AAV0VBZ6_9STRA|nr:unnamed protein product [Peronospora destructor]